jgi:hypothetical protein
MILCFIGYVIYDVSVVMKQEDVFRNGLPPTPLVKKVYEAYERHDPCTRPKPVFFDPDFDDDHFRFPDGAR